MKRIASILAIYVALAAFPADAHHSHPFTYDQCKSVTLEGKVEKVEFKNPHSILIVKLDDGTDWTVDWAPTTTLRRTGVLDSAMTALAFGSRVVVTGNPIRTLAEIQEHFPSFNGPVNPNTVDPMAIRRADNSFTWAPAGNLNCDRK